MNSELIKVIQSIQKFTPQELDEFRIWYTDYDDRLWEANLERTKNNPNLEVLASEAIAEYLAGRSRKL